MYEMYDRLKRKNWDEIFTYLSTRLGVSEEWRDNFREAQETEREPGLEMSLMGATQKIWGLKIRYRSDLNVLSVDCYYEYRAEHPEVLSVLQEVNEWLANYIASVTTWEYMVPK